MKIVDRQTFLAMPAGTVFSKYKPYVIGDIAIKGDTHITDFYVQPIADAVDFEDTGEYVGQLNKALNNGASVPMDFNTESRDGLHDKGQLFAVWEHDDVQALIERLEDALTGW